MCLPKMLNPIIKVYFQKSRVLVVAVSRWVQDGSGASSLFLGGSTYLLRHIRVALQATPHGVRIPQRAPNLAYDVA